jgi:rhomboid protease GluP
VTYVLLAVNVLVFLADMALGRELSMLGWKQNDLIVQGQYWRLLTPMFLHGGLLHIGFNSYALYLLGPQIERSFGSLRFLMVYFTAGLAGSIASFALTPAPSVGASGAIFGLLGAFLPYLYRNREYISNTRGRIQQIAMLLGINLLIGLQPGIDNWAHLGGLIGGAGLAWFITPLYTVEAAGFFSEDLRLVDESNKPLAFLFTSIAGIILLSLTFALIMLKTG